MSGTGSRAEDRNQLPLAGAGALATLDMVFGVKSGDEAESIRDKLGPPSSELVTAKHYVLHYGGVACSVSLELLSTRVVDALTVWCGRDTRRALAICQTGGVALRRGRLADPSSVCIGTHRDELLRRFGEPQSIDDGVLLQYGIPGQQGYVWFRCDPYCNSIFVNWSPDEL